MKITFLKEIKATNSLEDILDESVIQRNGWMMYGSHKPGSLSYELTGIYYINTDEIIEPRPLSMYDNNQRVKLFCIRGRKDAQRPLLDGKLEMIQQYLAQKVLEVEVVVEEAEAEVGEEQEVELVVVK